MSCAELGSAGGNLCGGIEGEFAAHGGWTVMQCFWALYGVYLVSVTSYP